jgi:2-polyprenyl-6-methoxyphenol hydroxylase-like FAD-dependent oxidoreductase
MAGKNILISGAGIAGPTLAYFLAKIGANVTVVEKAPEILLSGQNIDIQKSARRVIDFMGLKDEVLRNNTTEKGTAFINDAGQAFATLPVQKGKAASFTSEYEILRADLSRVLCNATANAKNVSYRFGTTVEEVLVNDRETVKVKLSDGSVAKYDLLVAADGQWSKVRRQCFEESDTTVIDKGMSVVYFTVPRTAEDNDLWNIYPALKSRVVSVRPDPYNTLRACLTIMPGNDTQRKAWQSVARSDRKSKESLTQSEFSDAGWITQRLLREMPNSPDFYLQPVQQIKLAKWHKERVVCLGDAGYAPSPLTGMGTSLAILGSYLLAGELSRLKDGEHPSLALEAYERIFRKFVDDTQEIPWFVPAVAHPERPWKRWVLCLAMRSIAKIAATPWIANRFASDDQEDFKLPIYEALITTSAQRET